MSVLAAVVAITLLVSAMCSLFEATLFSTRIATLESASKIPGRRHAAQRFLKMKHDVAVPTSAILILNTIANTAGASLAGMYAADLMGNTWVPAFSIGLTFSILFFSEIFPKTYGATQWRSTWELVVWPLAFIERALYPLIRITQRFSRSFAERDPTPVITSDEIHAMIHVGARAGEVTGAELKLLDAVFHFDRLLCRQVMVPRGEVDSLTVESTLPECIALARKTQHTRYPLCRGSLDEVLGIVHVKDLMGKAPDEATDLLSISRPANHVPETKRIHELLTEMQRSHQHMAIVVDEHGSTAGVITLENILEEIVGSVQDEFDREGPVFRREGPDTVVVEGSSVLERLNRELKLALREPGVNTLSGLLAARLGRFPEKGDRVELLGAMAEVLSVTGSQADRVRLTLEKPDTER